MLDDAEVLGPETEQRRPVELRVAAYVVVLLRREGVAVRIRPGLVGRVLAVDEDRVGVPVVTLTGEVVASLEQQDPLAGRRQLPGERAAARATADDDDVVVLFGHRHA